ncbi:MAG: cyclic nucleotide-binding domain-containing protein, partial [Lacipirellulaceae bacterium]
MEVAVSRPQRWDQPFSPSMRDVDVEHLLQLDPFAQIDAQRFPASLSLRDLLLNDTRIVDYKSGDFIVREGDYGSSAFLILQGNVRVVLSGLSAESMGRPSERKRSWWSALWQLATNPKLPEVRHGKSSATASFDLSDVESDPDSLTSVRKDAEGPRVFVQDVPRLVAGTENDRLGPGELFGEYAAMTRSQRPATVFAEGEVT